MANAYESPWVRAKAGKPELCHYGCGQYATLIEPGNPWKAHKVCAEGDLGARGSEPLGAWDGSDHKPAEGRPLGCGSWPDSAASGRFCAGTGAQLSCQLCPRSPGYWGGGPDGPVAFFGTVTDG